MLLLAKHFPALREINGITVLNKKPYINHEGLMFLAASQIQELKIRMLPISSVENGDFYFKCTIETVGGKVFEGHGNANGGNIKGVAKNRPFEMADTRAQNRALRAMLGLGGTTAEEIPEGAELNDEPPQREESQWSDLERKRFCAAVKDIGMDFDVVVYICEQMSGSANTPPHPRLMTEQQRQTALNYLRQLTPAMKDGWQRDYNHDVGGAPNV